MKSKETFYLQLTYVKHFLKVLDSVLCRNCNACQGKTNIHVICAVRYWESEIDRRQVIDSIYEQLWDEIDVTQIISEWKIKFNKPIKVYPGWYEDTRDLLVYLMTL